ncbi:hypothetical protein Pla52n_13920 [Stieleria varia]|uniref:Uncharacterized protein n=1 Tax=Stieleria varia TaxID=2528005 RepID=A0A5C6B1I2_9BACT|nr:hypothetical protein Pla52n_13920 [Stieleria varia]
MVSDWWQERQKSDVESTDSPHNRQVGGNTKSSSKRLLSRARSRERARKCHMSNRIKTLDQMSNQIFLFFSANLQWGTASKRSSKRQAEIPLAFGADLEYVLSRWAIPVRVASRVF